jgi:hypothetical protein
MLAVLMSFVLLWAGTPIALTLLEPENASTLRRAAGVVIGVGSLIPWLVVAWVMTKRSDEYQRQMLRESMALAFVLTIVVLAAADFLSLAHFIPWGTLPAAWQMAVLLWGVAIVIIKVRQRAQ